MLIATFNDATGWRGKTIAYEDDHLILEGRGRVSPTNIMKYDEKGQLTWASEGMRAWVGSMAEVFAANHSSKRPPRTKTVGFPRHKDDVFDAVLAAVPRCGSMNDVGPALRSGPLLGTRVESGEMERREARGTGGDLAAGACRQTHRLQGPHEPAHAREVVLALSDPGRITE